MHYHIAVEEKELDMLIIASIRTLKRGNEKCGNKEAFNLAKDSIDGVIKKEVFNNLLDILVQNQSVKRNKIGNLECLYFSKETLQVSHELLTSSQKSVDSCQTTVESSQLIEGFIKTTDHRPTDPPTTYHLPTYPSTTYPPTHRLTIIKIV